LHLKLDLYEAAKIPEYLVIVLYEQETSGTFWLAIGMSSCRPIQTAFGARASSPAYGWTGEPSWPPIWPRSWPAFTTGSSRRSTSSLFASSRRGRPPIGDSLPRQGAARKKAVARPVGGQRPAPLLTTLFPPAARTPDSPPAGRRPPAGSPQGLSLGRESPPAMVESGYPNSS
jgi:hypothetical protein